MRIALLLISVVITFSACRKEPMLGQLINEPVVVTYYDRGTDFNSLNTFCLPSTVGLISNTNPNDTLLGAVKAAQILGRLNTRLTERGFNSVDISQNPDMVANVFVIKDLNTNTVVSPGYWSGYGGYYDPYYWGYPGSFYYYPYSYAYTYETGTLVVELIDLKHRVQNNNKLYVVWNMLASGVLSDSNGDNMQKAFDAIDQSFVQSPSLKSN
jgi:Domain of unknown function (DUF4136)